MSWTPPHSSPGGPPAPGPHAAPPPYAFAPHQPPAPAPPRKRSRTGLIVALIAIPLALIIGATAVVVMTLTTGKQLSDDQGRVTITVPRTWSDDTSEDAGERVEQGEDTYTIGDVEASGLTGAVMILVQERATTSPAEAHEQAVAEECDILGCLERGEPTTVLVNGRQGREQAFRHPDGEATTVLTLESGTLVVVARGRSHSDDREATAEILRTTTLNR